MRLPPSGLTLRLAPHLFERRDGPGNSEQAYQGAGDERGHDPTRHRPPNNFLLVVVGRQQGASADRRHATEVVENTWPPTNPDGDAASTERAPSPVAAAYKGRALVHGRNS